jgi:transposase InsO family protein
MKEHRDRFAVEVMSRVLQVSVNGYYAWLKRPASRRWHRREELAAKVRYATFEQARQSIFEYIEAFYNRTRRHSSLGYGSPEALEAALN